MRSTNGESLWRRHAFVSVSAQIAAGIVGRDVGSNMPASLPEGKFGVFSGQDRDRAPPVRWLIVTSFVNSLHHRRETHDRLIGLESTGATQRRRSEGRSLPASFINDPKHWEEYAEEARVLAE